MGREMRHFEITKNTGYDGCLQYAADLRVLKNTPYYTVYFGFPRRGKGSLPMFGAYASVFKRRVGVEAWRRRLQALGMGGDAAAGVWKGSTASCVHSVFRTSQLMLAKRTRAAEILKGVLTRLSQPCPCMIGAVRIRLSAMASARQRVNKSGNRHLSTLKCLVLLTMCDLGPPPTAIANRRAPARHS